MASKRLQEIVMSAASATINQFQEDFRNCLSNHPALSAFFDPEQHQAGPIMLVQLATVLAINSPTMPAGFRRGTLRAAFATAVAISSESYLATVKAVCPTAAWEAGEVRGVKGTTLDKEMVERIGGELGAPSKEAALNLFGTLQAICSSYEDQLVAAIVHNYKQEATRQGELNLVCRKAPPTTPRSSSSRESERREPLDRPKLSSV